MPKFGARDTGDNSHSNHAHCIGIYAGPPKGPVQYECRSYGGTPKHQTECWNIQAPDMYIRNHPLSSIDVSDGNRSRLRTSPIFTQALARSSNWGDTISMATITYRGLEVLYSHQKISERVAELGAQITRDLNGEKAVMVGVLKGAAIFLADLARAIQVDTTFDFVAVSSYGKGQRSSGAVKLIKDLDEPIEGKNVLIVEDILDTGLTLSYLRKIFLQQRPKTLRIAALLDKPSRRIEKIDADYVGFSIPNLFVIGYGMDYAERYRNLPDICLMSPDHPE